MKSEESGLELAPEARPGEPGEGTFWKKLKRGLLMSHTELLDRLGAAVSGRGTVDEVTLEELEECLIGADLGVETSLELVEGIRQRVRAGEERDLVLLQQMLVDEMAVLLLDAPRPAAPAGGPRITLLVGVNGTGKTTTAAKLGRRALDRKRGVLLAAADTFRAAAAEQLALWAERLGVQVVRGPEGADPAAVVFDALQAARARGIDEVVVDTAGRLHTKEHLMRELSKIDRVIQREAGDWERRTLLVLDATTGQNAVTQAREFARAVAVDGVVLAKVDGTAKGGVAVSVARDLRLPVVYLGVGEGDGDLVEFRPREFAAALLG